MIAGLRLIGAFGHREMEIAALWILDQGLLDQVIRDSDFARADGFARDGYRELKQNGWLREVRSGYVTTNEFKQRVSRDQNPR